MHHLCFYICSDYYMAGLRQKLQTAGIEQVVKEVERKA
jgi:hypothetical protein